MALFGVAQVLAPERGVVDGELPVAGDDVVCAICHPGPARGLRQSVHAALMDRGDSAVQQCSSCHGDLSAHVAAASRPGLEPSPLVPRVDAAACASCHSEAGYETSRGRHALRPAAESVPWPSSGAGMVAVLEQQQRSSDLDWSGLVDLGYRFVAVRGSQDAFDTDVDLDSGLRPRELELRGTGRGRAYFDSVSLQARDLGDPRWDLAARAQRDEAFDVGAGFSRGLYRYRASGDYHRVDRRSETTDLDFEVEMSRDLRLFGSYQHRTEDGFWLTERIGNTNVVPQTVVEGVESPREFDGDFAELGLSGEVGAWAWTLAGLYREDRSVDRWFYNRPAPANPAFDESEDFTSRSTLRGPGGRMTLALDLDGVSIDAAVRYFDHRRELRATGFSAGYDIAEFTTDTDATGQGTAETVLVDLGATVAIAEQLDFVVASHWRDYDEEMVLQQTDVTFYPSLNTTIVAPINLDLSTSQRLFEAEALFDWAPTDEFELGFGYGMAHEWLSVPDLEPNDPRDFTSGYSRDAGPLADLRWAFADGWTLRASGRQFGRDGVALHELTPSRVQESRASVGWQQGGDRATLFARRRQNDNSTSGYHLDSLAVGLDAGVSADDLWLSGTYTYAQIESRTLTNFYFDPDPNPVPTFVGFTGDTHTLVGSLVLRPDAVVRWEFNAAWTKTVGSFDVSVLDWRGAVRWNVLTQGDVTGALGLEYRQLLYRERSGVDDYDARLVFLFWRTSW